MSLCADVVAWWRLAWSDWSMSGWCDALDSAEYRRVTAAWFRAKCPGYGPGNRWQAYWWMREQTGTAMPPARSARDDYDMGIRSDDDHLDA